MELMTSSSTDRVAAVVLAAGSSTRMGRNKLILSVDGQPMIRGIVEAANRAALDPVLVVLGHESERVEAALQGLAVRFATNASHEAGMTSSLRTGIGALLSSVGAAIMILGDMPFVDAEMLQKIAETHRSTGSPLVLSDYAGVQAPPTLFSQELFPELLDLDDESVPRRVVTRHLSRATVLYWPANRLRDVDSPEDLEEAGAID